MRRSLSGIVLVLCACSLAALHAAAQPASMQIIVHPAITKSVVDRSFLADAFLKKVVRWPDGSPILPIDQRVDSPIREQFSASILQRPAAAVRSYWQQMIFGGRNIPPPEVESDEAVVRYVLNHRGAVGYVSGGTSVSGAKILRVR